MHRELQVLPCSPSVPWGLGSQECQRLRGCPEHPGRRREGFAGSGCSCCLEQVCKLTFGPRGPMIPLDPIGPAGPFAPWAPAGPRGPVSPVSPYATAKGGEGASQPIRAQPKTTPTSRAYPASTSTLSACHTLQAWGTCLSSRAILASWSDGAWAALLAWHACPARGPHSSTLTLGGMMS